MKRLTLDELISMERLTGRQYCLNGKPRAKPRTQKQDNRLNIPEDHRSYLIMLSIQSPQLKALLIKAKSTPQK